MRQHATLAVALLALVATQSGRCSRPFAIPAVVLEVADETAEHSNADLQSRARVTAQATARGISARDVAEAGLGYPAYRYDEEDGGRVERVRKVAYLKTHKTASTTLGSILYRHAARNHLRIFCSNRANCEVVHIQPLTKIEKSLRDHPNDQKYDVFLNHISPDGRLSRLYSFNRIEKDFAAVAGVPDWTPSSQEDSAAAMITIVRDPRRHLLSWYNYYTEPVNQIDITKLIKYYSGYPILDKDLPKNILAGEFGVSTEADLQGLFEETSNLTHFSLILLSDRMPESLLVMSTLFDWPLADMTHVAIYSSHADDMRRWDGKLVLPTPEFDELPEDLQKVIDDRTQLDRKIYSRAEELLDEKIEFCKTIIPDWDEKLSLLKKWQTMFHDTCAHVSDVQKATQASDDHDDGDHLVRDWASCVELCDWYRLSDQEYESRINNKGYSTVPPAGEWETILANLEDFGTLC